MQKQNHSKLFAFKLAEKKMPAPASSPWKARDGVAVAGCSAVGVHDQYRDSSKLKPNDSGQYC